MKTCKDYLRQYFRAVKNHCDSTDSEAMREAMKIACIYSAWMADNKTTPWEPDYTEKLNAVQDTELAEALRRGHDMFFTASADDSDGGEGH